MTKPDTPAAVREIIEGYEVCRAFMRRELAATLRQVAYSRQSLDNLTPANQVRIMKWLRAFQTVAMAKYQQIKAKQPQEWWDYHKAHGREIMLEHEQLDKARGEVVYYWKNRPIQLKARSTR